MWNKTLAIAGIISVISMCILGIVIVKETEETERVAAVQEFQSKDFKKDFREAIDRCYDEYDEIDGVNTVVLIDGLSNIEYSMEDKDSKESILEQFIPLFKETTKLNLDDKPLTDLFDVILRG